MKNNSTQGEVLGKVKLPVSKRVYAMSSSSPIARCQENDPSRDLTQTRETAIVISVESESFSCNDVQTGVDY